MYEARHQRQQASTALSNVVASTSNSTLAVAAVSAAAAAAPDDSTGSIFAGFKRRRVSGCSPVNLQVEQYLDMCDDDEGANLTSDCLRLFAARQLRFPLLYKLALQHFSVPASSVTKERVFSHGGIIMRPHRASLGDDICCLTLST